MFSTVKYRYSKVMKNDGRRRLYSRLKVLTTILPLLKPATSNSSTCQRVPHKF